MRPLYIDTLSTNGQKAALLFTFYTTYRGLLSERIGSKLTFPKRKYTYILEKIASMQVSVTRVSNTDPEAFDKIIVKE